MDKFNYFETTADIGIDVRANSLEDAFISSALATMNLVTDVDKINPVITEEVELVSEDLYALLYDWVTEVIMLMNCDFFIASKYHRRRTAEARRLLQRCGHRQHRRLLAGGIQRVRENGNNSVLNTLSWQSMKPGIRIMHIKADFVKGPWWNYFKYENGSEETGYDDEGIRLLRLVNDGKDPFDSGDIIDSSVSGFGWYDVYGNETLDVGVKVHIGEIEDDCYTITVSCE